MLSEHTRRVQVSLQNPVFISFGYIPEMGLLDHKTVLFSIFWGTAILCTIVTIPVYILPNSAQGFPFSTSLPTLTSCLFHNSWQVWGDVSLWFWFVFSLIISSFSYTCQPSVYCLSKHVYSGFPHTSKLDYLGFLLLSRVISSYSLDSNPLFDKRFADISFHRLPLPFVPCALQKLYNLTSCRLFLLLVLFVHIQKKMLPRRVTGSFSPMFSSRNFMVSSFMLRSLIHC